MIYLRRNRAHCDVTVITCLHFQACIWESQRWSVIYPSSKIKQCFSPIIDIHYLYIRFQHLSKRGCSLGTNTRIRMLHNLIHRAKSQNELCLFQLMVRNGTSMFSKFKSTQPSRTIHFASVDIQISDCNVWYEKGHKTKLANVIIISQFSPN